MIDTNVAGLVLDVFGACFLAAGIIGPSVKQIKDVGGNFMEINNRNRSTSDYYRLPRVLHTLNATTKAEIGLCLLVLGFLLQILSRYTQFSEFNSLGAFTLIMLLFLSAIIARARDHERRDSFAVEILVAMHNVSSDHAGWDKMLIDILPHRDDGTRPLHDNPAILWVYECARQELKRMDNERKLELGKQTICDNCGQIHRKT